MKFGKINPKIKDKIFLINLRTEGWRFRFNLNMQISKLSSLFLKMMKCNLSHFQRFFVISWRKQSRPPLKWQNTGVKHFNFFKNMLERLNTCMLRLNLKRLPSVLRLIKCFFFYFLIYFDLFYFFILLPWFTGIQRQRLEVTKDVLTFVHPHKCNLSSHKIRT